MPPESRRWRYLAVSQGGGVGEPAGCMHTQNLPWAGCIDRDPTYTMACLSYRKRSKLPAPGIGCINRIGRSLLCWFRLYSLLNRFSRLPGRSTVLPLARCVFRYSSRLSISLLSPRLHLPVSGPCLQWSKHSWAVGIFLPARIAACLAPRSIYSSIIHVLFQPKQPVL